MLSVGLHQTDDIVIWVWFMTKCSAAEISTANIHENLLKLRKTLFVWAVHALRTMGPYNFET